MKIKLLLSIFTLLVSGTMVSGATLAWFTDSSTPIVNEFTAGTVEIVADETISPEISMQENWNPGDCALKEYTIINTGTKSTYIRAKITGQWYENDGQTIFVPDPLENVVSWTSLDGSWIKQGDYWYYESVVPGSYTQPDEALRTLTLNLQVCLDGAGTDNQYQGKQFKLSAEFEAVQGSNNAVDDAWPQNPYSSGIVDEDPDDEDNDEDNDDENDDEDNDDENNNDEDNDDENNNDETLENLGSAWADGSDYGRGLAKYFIYQKNEASASNPYEKDLYMGADKQKVGTVKVWNLDETIFIKVETISSYLLNNIHAYIGDEQPVSSAPGQLGYAHSPSQLITEYVFSADMIDTQDIYIALHAEIY